MNCFFTTADYGTSLILKLVSMYRTTPARLKEIKAREQALVPVPVWQTLERPNREEAIAAYQDLHAA